MRRTIYKSTLSESRPNPFDPRTLSCLNSSESVPDMTSNYIFLLKPSYSSTNLSDKHIVRLGPNLTYPRNNLVEEMISFIFVIIKYNLFDKHLMIPILLIFRSRDPLLLSELMPSSTLLPFSRLGPSLKVLHRPLCVPQVRT